MCRIERSVGLALSSFVAFVCTASFAATTGSGGELADKPLKKGRKVMLALAESGVVSGRVLKSTKSEVVLDTQAGVRSIRNKDIKLYKYVDGAEAQDEDEEDEAVRINKARADRTRRLRGPRSNPLLQYLQGRKPAKGNRGSGTTKKAKEHIAAIPFKKLDGPIASRFGGKMPRVFHSYIRSLQARAFDSAVKELRGHLRDGSAESIKEADTFAREHFSRSYPELVAITYLQHMCLKCKGDGVFECQRCNGTGYMFAFHQRGQKITAGTRKLAANNTPLTFKGISESGRDVYRSAYVCVTCRGHGYDPCSACWGTRLQFHMPVGPEAENYADKLLELGDECLKKPEHEYAATGSDMVSGSKDSKQGMSSMPWSSNWFSMKPMLEQVVLCDSANRVKSHLMRLYRAETFYQWARRADPLLFLRKQRNLHQEITRIIQRRMHLFGELSERQQVYAQNRSERRLNELVRYKWYGKEANEIIGDE